MATTEDSGKGFKIVFTEDEKLVLKNYKDTGIGLTAGKHVITFVDPSEEPTKNPDGSYTYNMKIVEDDN